MKTSTGTLIAIVMLFYACNQKHEQAKQSSATQSTQIPAATAPVSEKLAQAAETFDLNKIPVSTEDIGTFPYLSAPEGYKYSGDITKRFEEKYFFYQDSLVTKVAGQYFYTSIAAKSGLFEDTYIVNSYKQAIEKLGGIEIYSGSIPDKARELIDKEKPAYAEDMYDPMPYEYKQFIIRTSQQTIWIELCHKLNATLVDLTVLREETLKGSVGIIKAADIKSQMDKTGKAILYINFDTDKSSLKEDGVMAVGEIAKLLDGDKTLTLSIEGHTDNTGDASHNKTLSTERATTVLRNLVALNIDSKRLKATGYGMDKPLVANDTEDNKAKNRRVELVKIKG